MKSTFISIANRVKPVFTFAVHKKMRHFLDIFIFQDTVDGKSDKLLQYVIVLCSIQCMMHELLHQCSIAKKQLWFC